jgi:hypothetical protein
MRGMTDAKQLLVGVLAAGMPAKVAELNSRYGYSGQNALPAPKLYAPVVRDALEIAEFPALLADGRRADAPVMVDLIDGSGVYTIRYLIRIYLWVLAQSQEQVIEHRDRLTQAVREVLLDGPQLDATGYVDTTSFVESYSDTAQRSDGRLAGAFVELPVTLEETLTATPVATAEETTLTVLPHHPALD